MSNMMCAIMCHSNLLSIRTPLLLCVVAKDQFLRMNRCGQILKFFRFFVAGQNMKAINAKTIKHEESKIHLKNVWTTDHI